MHNKTKYKSWTQGANPPPWLKSIALTHRPGRVWYWMNNWQWETTARMCLPIFSAVSEYETILAGHCAMWPGILYSYKTGNESERTRPFTPLIRFISPLIHSCLSSNQQLSLCTVWFTLRTVPTPQTWI